MPGWDYIKRLFRKVNPFRENRVVESINTTIEDLLESTTTSEDFLDNRDKYFKGKSAEGFYQVMIPFLKRGVELNGTHTDFYRLGRCYFQLGDETDSQDHYSNAIYNLEKAINIYEVPMYALYLGRSQCALSQLVDDFSLATFLFDKGIANMKRSIEKSYSPSFTSMGHYYIGDAYAEFADNQYDYGVKQDMLALALDHFLKSYEQDSDPDTLERMTEVQSMLPFGTG